MSRKVKNGLDYFPLDTNLNSKWDLIQAKFGLEGFAITIKLLQEVYKDGYIYKIDDDILLLFADRNRIDENKLKEIINYCINKDLFDKDIFQKYNALTSETLQKNYFLAAKRRKTIEVTKEYCLVDNSFFEDNKITQIIYVNINKQNVDINPQIRKEEKRKEKKKNNKNKYLEFVKLSDDEYKKLVEQFTENGAKSRIENLNLYIGSKGDKYKSHYHTILSWERKNNKNNKTQNNANSDINKLTELLEKSKNWCLPCEDWSNYDENFDFIYGKIRQRDGFEVVNRDLVKNIYNKLRGV